MKNIYNMVNTKRMKEEFSSVEEENDAKEKFCMLMDWEITPEDINYCVKDHGSVFAIGTNEGQFLYDAAEDCIVDTAD